MDTKKLSRNFRQPDEKREFKGHGHLDVLNFEDGSVIGRGEFEPGWRWSNDVKPIAGTDLCEASHAGYCVEGSMTIRMKDGDTFEIKAGDVFHFGPGHDAWVDGNQKCVLVDFGGFREYAKKSKKAA